MSKKKQTFVWSQEDENWFTATDGRENYLAAALESDGLYHAYYHDSHTPETTKGFETLQEAKDYAEKMIATH